jgi:hypothetical protein
MNKPNKTFAKQATVRAKSALRVTAIFFLCSLASLFIWGYGWNFWAPFLIAFFFITVWFREGRTANYHNNRNSGNKGKS